MSSKIEINYIHRFEFCDRGHFMIAKGISIFAALAAYCCFQFLKYPHLNLLQQVATSVFFLCSGFGVAESYEKKRGFPHFWENRIIKIWFPSLLALIVISLIERGNAIGWIGKYPIALKGNLLYLFFGNYLAFWLLFKLFDSKPARVIGLFVLAVGTLFIVENTTLLRQLFCFPVGVMVSQYGWKRKVRKFHWQGKLVTVAVSAGIAVGGWFLANSIQIPYINHLLWGISFMGGAIFILVGVYALQVIPVFGIFAPFGYMSYILFLIHRDFLQLAMGTQDWRVFAAVVAALLAISLIGSWLLNQLVFLNKRLRRRKRTHLKGSMW